MPFVEHVLAVDIGGTKIEVGIVGVDGTIVDRRRTPSTDVADAEALFVRLTELLDEVAAHPSMSSVGVCGVGCGGPMRQAGEAVAPINIPVGPETLGRIMNVVGEPVDERGPIDAKMTYPIHRPAPEFVDQSTSVEVLETGIKVVDLIAPISVAARSACLVARVSARRSSSWS